MNCKCGWKICLVAKFFRKLGVRCSRHCVLRCTKYTEAVSHEADPEALCLKMHAGHKIAPDQTISLLHSNLKVTCQIQVNFWDSIYMYFPSVK